MSHLLLSTVPLLLFLVFVLLLLFPIRPIFAELRTLSGLTSLRWELRVTNLRGYELKLRSLKATTLELLLVTSS